jgi:hypothetical protein
MTPNATPAESRVNARVAASIAKETDTPVEIVQDLYDKEVEAIAAAAKIQQFVSVIASRRVKQRLREH